MDIRYSADLWISIIWIMDIQKLNYGYLKIEIITFELRISIILISDIHIS